ncbi:MAG: hypothetical protein WBL02_02145 [Methanomethylovorans sp.]|nr:hypothetical protein [Methanomethylovorans sp.]
MPFDTVEHNKKRNFEKNAQVYEGYERTDGFYSSCGQAFIRIKPDKGR